MWAHPLAMQLQQRFSNRPAGPMRLPPISVQPPMSPNAMVAQGFDALQPPPLPQPRPQSAPSGLYQNQGPPRPDYGPGSDFPLQTSPTGPDSTAMYAGSPETNPLLRPMGRPAASWAGTPFSGMLDKMSDFGARRDAGIIPKFINMMR